MSAPWPSRSRCGALAVAAAAAPAQAYVDPPGCPQSVQFDRRTSRRSRRSSASSSAPAARLHAAPPDADDLRVLRRRGRGDRATHDRVKVIRKSFGTSVLGQDLRFYVVSTPGQHRQPRRRARRRPVLGGHQGRLGLRGGRPRRGEHPAGAWAGSRRRRTAARRRRPRRSAGCSTSSTARMDCWNLRRLALMDLFLMPVRNPDGRDAPPGGVRTSAWAFDHNRDFGTQNQVENGAFLPLLKRYPGLFYIDAHQQIDGLLLPAQRGPGAPRGVELLAGLHPEPDRPGAAAEVQRPEHGVPQLQHLRPLRPGVRRLRAVAAQRRRRHDVREGHERGLRQAGLRPLPRDRRDGQRHRARQGRAARVDWTQQWQEAVDQGADCTLQPNKLVSPLRDDDPARGAGRTCGSAATSTGRTTTRATRRS